MALSVLGLVVLSVVLHRLTRDPLDGVSRPEILRRIWAADVIKPGK